MALALFMSLLVGLTAGFAIFQADGEGLLPIAGTSTNAAIAALLFAVVAYRVISASTVNGSPVPKGSVALITGASTGIGYQLAKLCIRNGYRVVIVARSADKLDAAKKKLEGLTSLDDPVISIPMDLAVPGAAEALVGELQSRKIRVDLLANNAGFGSQLPFAQSNLTVEAQMIHLNVTTLVELTHLLLPSMLEQGRGRILNIASTAAYQSIPTMATYAATKAFVRNWSLALSHELRRSPVTVTCICPGATHTEFAARAGNGSSLLFRLFAMPASSVAQASFSAWMRGEALAIPGLMNWVMATLTPFIPTPIVLRLSTFLLKDPMA